MVGLAALSSITGLAQHAHAQVRLTASLKATIAQTVYVTAPPGDTSRLFTVQRNGGIRILDLPGYTQRATPFLTVPNVTTGGEQGMLSMAFHPNYTSNGWFYFYYTRLNGPISTVIARCKVSATDPNVADPATLQDVLVVPNPTSIHQGGWIGFGPDGLLYIPLGDNAASQNGQNNTSLRGKILRIDVDGPDNIPGNADDDGFPEDATKLYTIPPTNPFLNDPMPDEVWVTGVRNPFRCSFDRLTGDFWVGDVGNGSREEVTRLTINSGGSNLGWPCAEGNLITNPSCVQQMGANYVPPTFDYRTGATTVSITGGCYVIGGYMYRGSAMPCLKGTYVFSDGCAGVFSLVPTGINSVAEFTRQSTTGYQSMGEDASGELYLVRLNAGGTISRIEPDGLIPGTPDCDNNGFSNACELRLNITLDVNNNSIPDGCEGLCSDIDFNNNSVYPEDADIIDFFNVLAGADCVYPQCDTIDFNRDNVFPDDQDVIDFFNVLAGGTC
ncbi:MAG TPA: PQQ-dependent sugar dehydrogenase [Phycisphaerales bacterium]|nr:PQQ-dependent sugar dehydrogenase [Phycisphaerales bacterium]